MEEIRVDPASIRSQLYIYIYVLWFAVANYVKFGHCYKPGCAAQVACVVNTRRANCFYFRRTSPSFRAELRARRNSIFKYRIISHGGTARRRVALLQQRANNGASPCVFRQNAFHGPVILRRKLPTRKSDFSQFAIITLLNCAIYV